MSLFTGLNIKSTHEGEQRQDDDGQQTRQESHLLQSSFSFLRQATSSDNESAISLTPEKKNPSSHVRTTKKKFRKTNKLKPGHARQEALQVAAQFEGIQQRSGDDHENATRRMPTSDKASLHGSKEMETTDSDSQIELTPTSAKVSLQGSEQRETTDNDSQIELTSQKNPGNATMNVIQLSEEEIAQSSSSSSQAIANEDCSSNDTSIQSDIQTMTIKESHNDYGVQSISESSYSDDRSLAGKLRIQDNDTTHLADDGDIEILLETTKEGSTSHNDHDQDTKDDDSNKEEFISKKVINIKKVLDSKVKQNEFLLNKVKIEYETYVKSTTEYYQQRLDLRHELSKLFDEQDKAAAREDYEMAEEMNNKIDDLRDQLSITAVTHRHHQDNQQTTSILNKYIDAYKEEINAYKIAVEELVDIETEEKVFIEERQKQLNDELHQIKHLIEAKEDRLKRLRSRVVLDRQHIENEENLLKAEVENKTQVYSSRINVLTLELSDIRKEIVNLEKLLEEARLKEVEHVLAIEKEQKNIDIVKKELSLEWSDLSEEKLKIKCREDQLEDEEKKLQLYQRECDTKMEGLGQAGFRADSAFGCISALISESKTDLDKKNLELEKFKTFRKKWPCNTSQVAQTLSFRKELQELTNNVAKLTTEVTNKEAMIATLKKRSAEIQDKCSELQTAKKLAADRRNFREAKKLANELKALNEEHQNYKLQLQAVEVDLESHSADLVQAQTLLSNRQKEVNSIEMKECSSLLVIIVDSIKKLESQLEILSSEDLLRTVIQQELTVYMMIKNELDSLVPKLNVGESALKIDLAESCNPEEIKYKMKKLESQLESAVVEEDYDLADDLHEQLKSLGDYLDQMKREDPQATSA